MRAQVRANLGNAEYLTQPRLGDACCTDAKLPPGLTLPKCHASAARGGRKIALAQAGGGRHVR